MNTHIDRLESSASAPSTGANTPAPWLARARAAIALSLVVSMAVPPVEAAQTQISNTPLASATSTQVKPNIMYLMDTSGSMSSLDMPDEMGSYTSRIGYKTPLCNTVYYNRNITYVVPKRPDGSNFSAASFTAAYSNGFQNYPSAPSSTAINLSSSFKAHSADTAQPAYYYTYTGSQTITPLVLASASPVSYTVSTPCRDSDPNSVSTYNTNIATSGGGNWQKVQVTSTSGPGGTDERTNFANWYQYYRSRILMMKSTASRAFNQLTDSYRVGFITIEPGSPVSSTQYLPIADFDTSQRSLWFEKLFQQTTHDSTPLRRALSRVGRHYAGKTDGINDGMTGDPVQYSCQQNFTLLTTDGYWNGGGGVDLDGNSLDTTSTDSDIAVAPRPLWDGGATLQTTTNKSNTFRSSACSSSLTRTVQQQRRTAQHQTRTRTIKQRTQQIQQRLVQLQSRTVQHQTRTQQIQQRDQQIQSRTQQIQSRTQQLQRQTEQLQRSTDQLQANTEQLTRRVEQHRATQTVRTYATSVLVISATSTSPASLSITSGNGLFLGGTQRLTAALSSSAGSRQARSLAIAQQIAANLSGGYTVSVAATNCSGSNNPVSGCNSNSAYLTLMGPSVTNGAAVSFTGATNFSATTNSFSGGSTGSSSTVNIAGTCTVGTVSTPTGDVQTTACPGDSDTGVVPLLANSCTGDTAGAFNGSGARITCGSTTSGLQNLAASSCTTSSSYNSSGQRIIACNTVIGAFSNLSATSCTATGFNSSGQRTNCQTIISSAFANFASSTCTTTAPTFNTSGQRFTCQTTDTGFVNSASCTATTPAGSFNGSGTQITCQTTDTGFVNASSCTANGGPVSGLTVTCQTTDTNFVNSTSCTPNGGPVAGFTRTCQTVDSGFVNSAACTASVVGGLTTTCRTTSDTGLVNTNACTASNPPTGPTVTCTTVTDTGFVNAGTCTASNPASGPTITCQTTDTGFVFANSCTPTSPATFDVSGQLVTCQTTDTGFVNSGSCTASTTTGVFVTCNIASDTGAVNVPACTASDPASGPTVTCPTLPSSYTQYAPTKAQPTCIASGPNASGVSVECLTSASYSKLQYQTTTSTSTLNLATNVTTTTAPTTGSWTDLDGVCTNPAPTVPSARAWQTGDPPTPSGACTAFPCTTTSTSGGSNGSLADVAQYYYQTDLRPSMTNNVPAGGSGVEDDKATWQHMTTFTMGLGLSGALTYRTDYKTANTGDYQQIRDGTLNWPVPTADDPTALDDLWHAAVNGRGLYFSAKDPDAVVDGLTTALAGIQARISSAAAAATSNLEPVAGDNFAYTAKYKTLEWTGELEAHEIDLTTGDVKSAVIWSAQAALDTKVGNFCDNRNIYLFRSGATNNRVNFTWSTQACDVSYNPTGTADTGLNATEQAFFGSTAVAALSQYPSMTDGTGSPATANQRLLAEGSKMVNFVRGQRGYENFTSNDPGKLYRQRTHVLGDIVNAQPVYVKAPFASYTDDGYLNAVAGVNGGTAFKTTGTAATRLPMVYVASNDGMLHAFYAGTSTSDPLGGTERWSFIPSIVLPNLYRLADDNYANNHRYSVDGTPTVGDFYDTTSTTWKTMLVAGLNAGGKGFYALDVTDPATPKGLWEFKWSDTCYAAGDSSTHYADCHLGFTFSNPIITKMTDGTWVVLVTSGYNNVNSPAKTGDGQGYLYVLRAYDGKILYKISTGVGDATTPSGLNHIVNWVDSTLVNNTTLRVYGGDLLGNMWRFDINDTIAPAGREATKIGQAKSPGASGLPQPITTRPELALKGSDAFIMFATGRLVGSDDLADTQVQSIYGVVDPLTNTTTAYTDLRGSLKPMTMTTVGSGSTATRTIACSGTTAACNVSTGWVIDLPDSGERVNVDPKLQLGTLVVASNVPQTSACTIGGYSWINFVNFTTGAAVANSTGGSVSQKLSDSLAVGLNIVRLPDGKTVVITTTSDAKQTTVAAPFDTPSPTGKRISWREITN